MTAELSDDDRGKTVVAGSKRIGVVTDVAGGRAYVDVDPDHVDDGLRDALGWEDDEAEHTIDEDDVTAVQNAEVRLRDDLA